MEANW